MEIIAKKVRVQRKVISFLEGGEPGFSVGWEWCCYDVGGQSDPTRVSVGEEVDLPARLPGAGGWGAFRAPVWPRVWEPDHSCAQKAFAFKQTLLA